MTTATIQSIESKTKAMVGNSFLVNATHHKVASFRISEDRLLIATDKKIFEVDTVNALKLIESFLPADNDPPTIPAVEIKALAGAGEIKDIIMDNIRQLKGNPAFIPQAQAINESVKVLVDVAKTEVQMLDLMHKIRS
ncbi:hypothetical protein [Dyadobacter sp. SG02]|uniref:hypothetical protein n=1 Tax=Dyadobacter sp. SG02 TaxID=1855291 RepID=UPI00115FB56E|nr:hypothetical protein [Dyadobacter sp. SG02]